MCRDGLWVRVEDLYPRGQWFESPLKQFLVKTRAVNSVLGNRNMIGKIPTWWENSLRGNRKTVGKIPQWLEISLRGRKKVFRCMDHLVLRHPSYMRGFTYPFSHSVPPPPPRSPGKLQSFSEIVQALQSTKFSLFLLFLISWIWFPNLNANMIQR